MLLFPCLSCTSSIDAILLISSFHACAMSCELFMHTICTHDMFAMIPSSMLHLRTTSLLDLVTMIACFVASPMFHYYSLSWVDDIFVHASHMIHLVHCRLPPIVASMLIDRGDLDILLVMHACLIEINLFGCSCIMCFHTTPHLVCNAPDTPAGGRYSWRDLDWPHRSILVFSAYFVLTHVHPGATSRLVTHPDTTPS